MSRSQMLFRRPPSPAVVTPVPTFSRHLGDARYGGTSNPTLSMTISAGANVPVGDFVMVGIMLNANPPVTAPTVSDSKGNTYSNDVNGDNVTETGGAPALIYSTKVGTQLVAGTDTITLTLAAPGRLSLQISADHIKNLNAGTRVDKTAHAMTLTGSPNRAWAVGPTATLTQARAFAYVALCAGSGGGDWTTPPTGLTRTYFGQTTGSTSDKEGMTFYQVLNSTTGVSYSGTLASNTNWGGVVATYKGL